MANRSFVSMYTENNSSWYVGPSKPEFLESSKEMVAYYAKKIILNRRTVYRDKDGNEIPAWVVLEMAMLEYQYEMEPDDD